jgi:hypothetical protein
MNRSVLVLCALTIGTCPAGSASGHPPAQGGRGDLASQVRAVFAAKCAECHGPAVLKPPGGFGYVLDLARVASTPKIVVPFQPDESKLWDLVRTGEMPPDDAHAGPLTEGQQGVIRSWIEAGAPPASVAGALPSVNPPGGDIMTEPPYLSPARRLGPWLGRFHVLVVHFPIALLLAAAAAESWSVWGRIHVPLPAVHFCVLSGAAGAVAAAALGWLHASGGYGAGSPSGLALHRWIGTTGAVWAVGVALLSLRDARHGVRSQGFRIVLLVGAVLVGLAGHLGGTLVHGEDFFNVTVPLSKP